MGVFLLLFFSSFSSSSSSFRFRTNDFIYIIRVPAYISFPSACVRACVCVCNDVCELIKENALQVSLYQLIGHEKRISDILIRRKKKKEKERKKMRAFTFLLCTKLLNRD